MVNRNRCKFYVSTTEANISAEIYSLAITCEENEINPYMYFIHLLKKAKYGFEQYFISFYQNWYQNGSMD